tara:strand:- start:419 stop:646 length:228 start_codon:yes stop_codon:yes gene_type:complete
MEICFEFENSDLDVVFTPHWVSENHADHSKVQWEFSDKSDPQPLDDVFIQLETEESIPQSRDCLDGLRLLRRRDS